MRGVGLVVGVWLWGLGMAWGTGAYRIELVPYATTVLRFGEEVRYVATGWPYVQVAVLEGTIVLVRPLVKEGKGELWVMLWDGREYRLWMEVKEGVLARTYQFARR
ncbi:hypothetical protein [Thermus albus]|uniref:hypothetical protein n=1 Tax=Thermus albus TaxID=2908146 RepID=UPI001FA98DFC|nr:hypothetical protein [Thermus albus]